MAALNSRLGPGLLLGLALAGCGDSEPAEQRWARCLGPDPALTVDACTDLLDAGGLTADDEVRVLHSYN